MAGEATDHSFARDSSIVWSVVVDAWAGTVMFTVPTAGRRSASPSGSAIAVINWPDHTASESLRTVVWPVTRADPSALTLVVK